MDRREFARRAAYAGSVSLLGPSTVCGEEKPSASGAAPPLPSAAGDGPVTVVEYRELAKAKLPQPLFDYIDSGSMNQTTLRENTAAFERLQIVPPILAGVDACDLTTTVFGERIRMPILLAPAAAQRMFHPQGAFASARAAAALGTVFAVSSSVMNGLEEVAESAAGPKWFQLYLLKNHDVNRRLIERAERAGYKAIVLTIDLGEWKDADRRNRFAVPRDMLLKHLRDLGFADVDESLSHEALLAFNAGAVDFGLSWEKLSQLRSLTKLPLVLKGVLRPEDARRAVDAGFDGIVVSNHGGRRIDGMPASIDMLAGVVAAVGEKAEVYLDSGVRRGTDVLKALSLGARAVLVGRPYVWALAADGERGVRRVLEILRDETQNVLTSAGCRTVRDVPRSLVRP